MEVKIVDRKDSMASADMNFLCMFFSEKMNQSGRGPGPWRGQRRCYGCCGIGHLARECRSSRPPPKAALRDDLVVLVKRKLAEQEAMIKELKVAQQREETEKELFDRLDREYEGAT